MIILLLCGGLLAQEVVKTSSVKPVAEKSRTFVATAYCLKGRMANGERVHVGAIAASKALPFGSKLVIENFGTYTVKDRGRDIQGNRLDIYMPSCRQAIKFGKRKVQARVITKQT